MRWSPSNSRRARAGIALAALMGANAIIDTGAAWAAGPFERLAGGWSGSGRVTFEGGPSERLRCNARYRPSGGGSRLALSIRCASPSNSFELVGDLVHRGSRVSGSWQERTMGASGSIFGRASPNRIAVRFTGTAEGNMSVSTSGSRQTVTITSYGTALRAINVTLRRR